LKRLAVPAAAQRHLEDLLGFELDRETPFSRNEIHWDYRIAGRDKSRGTILVDLTVLPRANVDPALEIIRRAGFTPVGVEVGSADTGLAAIRLDHATVRRNWTFRQPLVLATAAACVLALAAVVSPFMRQHNALVAAEKQIDLTMAAAKEASALRQTLDQRAGNAGDIAEERARSGSMLAALAAVTRALPDDTYLTALNLRQGRAVMTGRAPSAAALVRNLAQAPALRDPAFESQVVSNEGGGLEGFVISVSVESPDKP
jgi:general secretion pathway protein L